jgi:hypothetical protein
MSTYSQNQVFGNPNSTLPAEQQQRWAAVISKLHVANSENNQFQVDLDKDGINDVIRTGFSRSSDYYQNSENQIVPLAPGLLTITKGGRLSRDEPEVTLVRTAYGNAPAQPATNSPLPNIPTSFNAELSNPYQTTEGSYSMDPVEQSSATGPSVTFQEPTGMTEENLVTLEMATGIIQFSN